MISRNPKYDGLLVYKIDVAKLMPGDVLLTRNAAATSGKGRLQSSAIMRVTRGNFSHALVCTVPPIFIEAVGHGVSNISAQPCFVHDLKNVRLLRYHDAAVAKSAANEALPLLGQKYSVNKAIRSILPSAKLANVPDEELFCSALVAAVFRKAGAAEFSELDPMKVTPATLENAECFTDVTHIAFSQILSPSNIEDMSAFDGDRVESPLLGQAELFQDFNSVLKPIIDEFIRSTPELTVKDPPATFLDAVFFIGAAKKACDQLSGIAAVKAKTSIAAIDQVAYDLLSDGRYEDMQKRATASDDESLQYTLGQSFLTDPDIDFEDTCSLISATRQQITSRSKLPGTRGEMANALTTKKWMELNDEVIQALNYRLAVLKESIQRAFPQEKY